VIRKASVVWEGNLRDGSGMIKLDSGSMIGPFSYASRYEKSPGSNPEELIAAAHAGCFSMALSDGLSQEGFVPEIIRTDAFVHLDKADNGFRISKIDLVTEAKVPRIEADRFQSVAEDAKQNCPVSRALSAVETTLKAALVKK
jgi:lipoyl-dependent peroxiredoxin